MAFLDIAKSALKSRFIRNQAQNGQIERIIGGLVGTGGQGNFWADLLGGTANFLVGIIGFVGWSFAGLAQMIISAVKFVWYFNWNITEDEINSRYQTMINHLSGLVGGTLGNISGYLVCGVLPSLGLVQINQALGLYVLEKVSEEAFEEFANNLYLLANTAFRNSVEFAFYEAFKGWRRCMKLALKSPTNPYAVAGNAIFGQTRWNEIISQWGSKGSQPWSFSKAFNDALDEIENPALQNFTEEFFDEFFDGCEEAFMVFGAAIDEWIMQEKLRNQSTLGNQQVVEIVPNRNVPPLGNTDRIVLAGPDQALRPVILNTMANYQLLRNRDVGLWVGEPVREALRTNPISIQLRIILNEDVTGKRRKSPTAFNKQVVVTIPNVERSKVDWQDIKEACGGVNGYMWGRFRAKARLSTGHDITCYASTASEAEERVKAYTALSASDIIGITVTEELREGNRLTYDNTLYKQPTRIYPIAFTIINQARVLNEESGRATLSGVYSSKKALIPLNVDTKPDNFDSIIADLFLIPGANP